MSFVRSSVELERRCEFPKLWDGHVIDAHKINKSPTVSNGVLASSFEIWTANLAQSLTVAPLTNSQSFIFGDSNWKFCKVSDPVDTQKPDIQMRTFLTWGKKLCFYFLVKKSKPVGYTRTLYSQTGENTKWAETFVWCLLLIFKGVYQDHLTQLRPFARDFVAKRAAAGLGPSGLRRGNGPQEKKSFFALF